MSVPVNLRHLPSHVKQSAYFPSSSSILPGLQHGGGSTAMHPGLVPLSFPATHNALWDKTPTGLGTTLHITKERNLHVHILEKTLRLAYRHTAQQHSNAGKTRAFLLGQALTNPDDDGVTITVDRFDPGHTIPSKPEVAMPTAKLPGDHVIPFTITINKEFDTTTHTEDGFKQTFELLQHHCSSRNIVDVANLVSLCVHCCCYTNDDDITFNLHIAGVTIGTSLELTPISSVPVIPTALARNLMGPLNISEVQGNPKSGFVTLDQTRKLLLLLDSDPKAYTLPLVGIWLSGISYIGSPVIWAACLRYILNSSIQERVCSASDGFLVILYSPNKRKPDFYQCSTSDGALSFQLVGCRENLHVFKHANVTNQAPVQLELRPARDGPNKSVFLEACKKFKPISWNSKSATTSSSKPSTKRVTIRSNRSDIDEDIHMVPRPSPKPIMDKSPTVRPSVPELSLIYDSFEEESHPHNIVQPSPHWHPNHDDVFLPHNAAKRQITHHQHQQKENLPRHWSSKPGHDDRTRQSVTRPGPLRDLDPNSPHGVGRKVRSQSKSSQRVSQPKQHVGSNYNRSGSPAVIHRHNSEPVMKPNIVSDRKNISPHPQVIVRQNTTNPPIGQGHASSPASTNQNMATGLIGSNESKIESQQQNVNFDMQDEFIDLRRTSAPLPRQYEPTNLIGQNIHNRQSLPNKATPYRHPQHERDGLSHHPQSDVQSRQKAIPPTVHPPIRESPFHNTQPQGVQHVQGGEFNTPQSTMDRTNYDTESGKPDPLLVQSLPDRVTPNRRHCDDPRQTGNQIVNNNSAERQDGVNESTSSSSAAADSVASNETREQLKRQEQMIRELQAQIQMLLHAQAAATALPSGVITPPTTPTSTNHNATSTPSTNQTSSTPVKHHKGTPRNESPTNGCAPRTVNHQSPPTRMVTTSTSPSPPRGVGCSIGVNTGQSLFWSPGGRGGEKTNRNMASETTTEKSSQQRSPQHTYPAARDAGNSTFDLESEPNMSVNIARDDNHSGISMIGPIEMNSSIDTTSRTSSPKHTPSRTNGEGVQSPQLSDSFRSPVLGESASTCRPPGRPIVSSDESEDEGRHGDIGPSLLYKDQKKFYNNILGNVQQLLHEPLSSDKKQVTTQHSHSSSISSSSNLTSESSSSEDSSEDEEDVTMGTPEDQGLLGLRLALPEDVECGSVEKSAMYRSMHNTSPDFFPRINYVSIMDLTLDSPNLSMEANALAMKYLSDEELAKLSIGFKTHSAATPRKDVNPLLRTALVGNMRTEKSMVGVSSVGFRAVDMSMASRKYMEKYGLLEIEDGDSGAKATPKSPKKKKKRKKKCKKLANSPKHDTTLSMEVIPEAPTPVFNANPDKDDRIRATPTLHPGSQQVSPVSEPTRETYEPWLKRPSKKLQGQVNVKSPENQRKDHVNRGQNYSKPVGNILDISRLQELPKLL